MLNRWIGITCALLMLLGNAALFVKDIYPRLTAGDPPRADALSLTPDDAPRNTQVGIFLTGNQRIGTSWTSAHRPGVATLVTSVTLLDPIPLPNDLVTPHVRINMELRYSDEKDAVDEIRLSVRSPQLPTIELTGEYTPPNDLPCKWTVGEHSGTFIMPADSTRALGDAIRPFNRLPGLYEGQTWRMKLFDPLAHIMPSLSAGEVDFGSMMVRVGKVEEVEHNGEVVEVFPVEAEGARAWVDRRDGRVLRQEVSVPLVPGGKLILIDEPFNAQAFKAANTSNFPDPPTRVRYDPLPEPDE